jgi:hypothetical protein
MVLSQPGLCRLVDPQRLIGPSPWILPALMAGFFDSGDSVGGLELGYVSYASRLHLVGACTRSYALVCPDGNSLEQTRLKEN